MSNIASAVIQSGYSGDPDTIGSKVLSGADLSKFDINEAVVIVNAEAYQELVENDLFLNCLMNNGVDNWDGYEFAQADYQDSCSDIDD